MKKIKVSHSSLREVCLWDHEFLFVGCDDCLINLINYKSGKYIKWLKGHKDKVISIKKILHPKYGNCLLSQSPEIDSIKLWVIK